MRVRFILLLVLLLTTLGVAFFGLSETTPNEHPPTPVTDVQPINSVLGNQSFRMVFGRSPTAKTPERLRLRTHLAVVETLLRRRDRSHLSSSQRERRAALLDALREYRREGRFPQNTEVPKRTPVFIDDEGRLCAVGHLIAESAGRDFAESIDEQYHRAHIREIDLAALNRWASRHGFSRQELALIQPQYCNLGPCPPRDTWGPDTEQKTASALEITGLSASIGASLLNGVLIERGSPSIVGGAVGVAGGATSVTVGLTDDAKYPTVSTLAGAASIALGTWSLISVIRGTEASESSRSVTASTDRNWHIAPTTITTGEGSTQPGLQATIQF